MQSLAVVCSPGKASHPTATQGNCNSSALLIPKHLISGQKLCFIIFVQLLSSPRFTEFVALVFFKLSWLSGLIVFRLWATAARRFFCKWVICNFDLPYKGQNHYICFTSVTSLLFYWNLDCVILVHIYCIEIAYMYRETEIRSMLPLGFLNVQELFLKRCKSSRFILKHLLSLLISLWPPKNSYFQCCSSAC